MKLGTILLAGLIVSGAAACKKKDKGEEGGKVTEGSAKGTGKASGSDKASGSAAGSGEASGSGSGSGSAAATGKTGDELVATYQACWDHWNTRKWDEFKGCFADDVVVKDLASGEEEKGADKAVEGAKMFGDAFTDGKAEAQLVLVNGNNVLGVWLLTGTNDKPMKTPEGEAPATNKKIGTLIAHGVEFNAEGKVVEEWTMMDMGSFLGQLGMSPSKDMPFRAAIEKGAEKPEIVIAKGDELETTNLGLEKAELEAFNAHNVDAMGTMNTDDLVWSEVAMPKDMTKQELIDGMKGMYDGFSDLKLDAIGTWAAGEYTVGAYVMSGTNTAPVKEMMLDGKGAKFSSPNVKITHRKDGKADKVWIFYNGLSMMEQLMGGGDKPADEGDKPADGADKPAEGDAPADEKKPE